MGDLSSTGLKAKLSNLAKQPLTVPVRIGDGDGLHLLVKPSGKPREQGQDRPKPIGGTWVLRYTFAGKRRDMGLGPYPAVSLADARDAAEKARRLIRNGSDPVADRDAARDAEAKAAAAAQARAVTFKEAALATVEAKRGGWTNPKHAGQWLATLEQHAFPHIGQKPVGEIDLSAVLTVLRPIWERIPETASRLRQRIEAVLDLAHVRGWRQAQNVARWRGLLAEELPPPRKVRRVEHRPALPWQQIPAFWRSVPLTAWVRQPCGWSC